MCFQDLPQVFYFRHLSFKRIVEKELLIRDEIYEEVLGWVVRYNHQPVSVTPMILRYLNIFHPHVCCKNTPTALNAPPVRWVGSPVASWKLPVLSRSFARRNIARITSQFNCTRHGHAGHAAMRTERRWPWVKYVYNHH